jgi:hypothetical protein
VSAYKNQLLKVNMKKMIRFLSVTAVLATAAAAAQAQVYVEGAVTGLTAKESANGIKTESKPSTFSGLVGYNVHPNVDVEGYLGLGAGKSDITENGYATGREAKVKSSFGVFVKPKVMVSPELEVFGRLGFLENKSTDSYKNSTTTSTQGSFAFGVGANYYFDKRTYVTGSYMNYHNKDGLKVNGMSIGMGYKF